MTLKIPLLIVSPLLIILISNILIKTSTAIINSFKHVKTKSRAGVIKTPTSLTQEGIPNPHHENQLSNMPNTSNVYDVSDNAMEDMPNAKVEIAST